MRLHLIYGFIITNSVSHDYTIESEDFNWIFQATIRFLYTMDVKIHPRWTKLPEEFLIEQIRNHHCVWDPSNEMYMKKVLNIRT